VKGSKIRSIFVKARLMGAVFLSLFLAPLALQAAPPMLKVSGNQIVTANGGCTVRLVGVNVDCLEWSANGQQTTNGVTEGILQTVQEAAAAWKANCVRIAIDQDWWDGNAQSSRGGTSQAAYQGIVDSIVAYCNSANLYCDLDLQWSGDGPAGSATGQYSMPDQNSLVFWQSVAARYANNPSVIFDVFNEPYPNSWSVWLNGGTANEGFSTPGFQAIVNKIRATQSGGGTYASGTYAQNICLVGGLGYSWDFQGMSPVTDPGGNGIVYTGHIYNNKGGCNCNTLWQQNIDPALSYGPVLIEEFGNSQNTTDNGAFVNSVIDWMNGNNDKGYVYGGMAWELGTEATPLLISDWNWDRTSYEGNQVYDWLQSVTQPACGPTATFTSTPTPIVSNTWRVNAGGPAYGAAGGVAWSADTNFTGGSAANQGTAITGATDPALYDTQRWGANFSYAFNVPAGNYQVSLYFAETAAADDGVGDRVFNVLADGTTVLANLDIFAQVGANAALVKTFNVTAPQTGIITLQFTGTNSPDANAVVEAIQIIPQPATPTATNSATRTFTGTPTSTASMTPSSTPSRTSTSTATSTSTLTSTATDTSTDTRTNTPVPPSPTPTVTDTATASSTPTSTATDPWTATPLPPSPTATASWTPSPTLTPTGTASQTPTASSTPTGTGTATSTGTGTPTATSTGTKTNTAVPPSPTPTGMDTPVNTPTRTSTSTSTFTKTFTPVPPSATATNSTTPTSTATSTLSSTFTGTPTFTTTRTDTLVPPSPSSTPTYTFTSTHTPTFTLTWTSTPTHTSTWTPVPPTWTATPTQTFSPTSTPTENAVLSAPIPYPNPWIGAGPLQVRVVLQDAQGWLKLKLFTAGFRMAREETFRNLSAGPNDLSLPPVDRWGRELANGLYYIQVQTAQGKSMGKLLILR